MTATEAQIRLTPVGEVRHARGLSSIHLRDVFRQALDGLDGFSHVVVVWWFDGADNPTSRASVTEERPYPAGPARVGTFATRAPERPNPIALSVAQICSVDLDGAVLDLGYLDAREGSPVLDIKPYTPSLDRVEDPRVPAWFAGWPRSVEASATFDWAAVMPG